ncbi:Protein NDNF [Holothuria leucospilota]|uniref:Protein NDNF n=1 Tax=Holothuria leucospilota TaxID=206669 RepID=A0A9Q0YNS2_HOLLE|nr:Protein NDNF [Holothuria leucospilota]
MGMYARICRFIDIMHSPLKPPLTLLLPLLLLVSRARLSPSQPLPSRDDNLWTQMQTEDLLQDNSILIDGAEMRAHIDPPEVRRYFFLVEEDNTPVSIMVTPCSYRIHWELFLMELPEDGSGSSAADQLSEQRQRRHPNSPIGAILKSYSGFDSSKYITYTSPAGVYVLAVRGLEDATNFMIYCTTSPDTDHYYPELPSDPRVDVTSFSKNRVNLAWKASPSETAYQQAIRYCVSINTVRNYHTWCGVMSRTGGRNRISSPAAAATDKAMRRAARKEKKRKGTTKARSVRPEEESDLQIECVGQKTLHRLTNLEPGRKYYIDLFAVDESTNRSTAYAGTTVTTKPEERLPSKTIRLKDGKLRVSSVRRVNPLKIFHFPVGDTPQTVQIAVQPCSQYVTLEIFNGDELLRESVVRKLKTFRIKKTTGELTIKVKSRLKKVAHFRVFATTNLDKFPFPSLPRDTRINVYKNLRQCNSVTLAWLNTKEDSQYCLYKREDRKRTSPGSKVETDQCHAPDMRKKNDKVLCRTVVGDETNLEVLTEVISGLDPDTTYVFDVYVTRLGVGQQSLAYKSKRVRTKRIC